MNMKDRIEMIRLQSQELVETASQLEKIKKKESYPCVGYGDCTADNCPTAVKRRITALRAELLELSKLV